MPPLISGFPYLTWLCQLLGFQVFCLFSHIMPSNPLRLQNGWPKICCGRIWKSTKCGKIPKNLKTYISRILAPKGGRPRSGRSPFGGILVWCRFLGFQVFCMTLLIFTFCHSIFLAIHFAISKDGLALYKKISKQLSFLQPCKVRCRCPVEANIFNHAENSIPPICPLAP